MKVARVATGLCLTSGLLLAGPATAVQFSIERWGIEGVVNNIVSVGAQWRLEEASESLIGKANLDPNVCRGVYQSCQGLFKDQIYPSQKLVRSPGAASMRTDNGNLNYGRYEPTQGGIRLTQDYSFTKGDYGLFARTIAFYDAIQAGTTDYYPNLITAENLGRTGITGDPVSNRYFTRVYGAGEVTKLQRTDAELRREQIFDVQLLDLNFYGKVNVPKLDKSLTFKLGRQTVNWGESTVLVINSINQAQPVNANNLNRFGFQLEEVFTPIAMAFGSVEVADGHTLEAFYQFEWKPVEIPTPGSFLSTNDIGSRNLGSYVNLSFGGSADDSSGKGFFLDNPLSLVTSTTGSIVRLPDRTPRSSGQFGFALKNYFEELNGGTEISLYFMNYHSRLPYVSFNAGQQSCAKRNYDGNHPLGANSTVGLLSACPRLPALVDRNANTAFTNDAVGYIATHLSPTPGNNVPLKGSIAADLGITINPLDPLGTAAQLAALQAALGQNVGTPGPYDSLVQLDSGPFFFEYPENIQLYGISFNTTAGDYSFQGEVAWRPNLPLQVAVIDVAFAAAQPFLTNCHLAAAGCAGSQAGGDGFNEDASRTGDYDPSDAVPGCTAAAGNCDTINLVLGAATSSARSFPSFLTSYRGGTLGDAVPGSYIRGYERFSVFQYNLGITRVLGATDNPIGADQILAVAEIGATHVPGLPSLDKLQIEAPGNYFHASAGADGSGADGSRQACSSNAATGAHPTCVVGPDGGRFNPHQANLHNYSTEFSWGYRLVGIFKYESVLPGISLAPFLVWSHDVDGIAPGPGENFIRGRKSMAMNIETRYKSALSATIGYNWFFGGGDSNLVRDRDNAQAFVRYQF